MGKIIWNKVGNRYFPTRKSETTYEVPPVRIYTIGFTREEGYFLLDFAERFEFTEKIYGISEQKEFIEYIMKTYQKTTKNLGILLNGLKGTGKTWCAKMLANRFNLPIILVDNPEHIDFIQSLDFSCVFLFDEFEKSFGEVGSGRILSFMDGLHTTSTRKIFIMTTNTTSIDSNFMSRPSRIRYYKEFKNLEKPVALEYLKDNLNDQDLIPRVLALIDNLTIFTIDILKTIVEEFNIHGDCLDSIKKWFNISLVQTRVKFIYRYYNGDGEDIDEEFKKFQETCPKINKLEPSEWDDEGNPIKKEGDVYPDDVGYNFYSSWESMSPEELKEGDYVWHGSRIVKKIQYPYAQLWDENHVLNGFIKFISSSGNFQRRVL